MPRRGHLELIGGGDLEPIELARLAAPCQRDPAYTLPYFGADAELIAAEIESVVGWRAHCCGAVVDGEVVGWLLGDADADIGRVWWWGPVAPVDAWHALADAMYAAVVPTLASAITQQECAGTAEHRQLAAFCARHGFAPGIASVALLREGAGAAPTRHVGPCPASQHSALAALHDSVFPGGHRTGEQLYRDANNHLVVAIVAGELVAYAAGQRQQDDSGYIDFVGVAPAQRGRGYGQAVVAGLLELFAAAGVERFHLTVREDNPAARALYRRLGFREDTLLVPYRKGFSL